MPRGVKTCPSCKETCGPRTRVCSKCGHNFFEEKPEPVPVPTFSADSEQMMSSEEPEQNQEPQVLSTGKNKVWALAGKPPKFSGDVEKWLDEVEEQFREYEVTPSAAIIFLRAVDPNVVTAAVKDQVRESFYRRRGVLTYA